MRAICWQPDGTHLAVSTDDGQLMIYEAKSATMVLNKPVVQKPYVAPNVDAGFKTMKKTVITAMQWTKDKYDILAIGDSYGTVATYRVHPAEDDMPMMMEYLDGFSAGKKNAICSLTWSKNTGEARQEGKGQVHLVAEATKGDVWLLKAAKDVQGQKVHQAAVTSTTFAPSTMRFATGSKDSTIVVWLFLDLNNFEPIANLSCESSVTSLSWSADCQLLAAGTSAGGKDKEAQANLWHASVLTPAGKLVGHRGW